MSDTTINVCGNIMFKSVKCIFLVIPKIWGFKKSTAFFTVQNSFFSKLVHYRLRRTVLAENENYFFLEENAIFYQNGDF